MAATIIEQLEDNEAQDLPADDAQSAQDLAADFEGEDTTAQEPQTPPEEDDIPDKYRGKSVKEIISMHQQAERLIGSQGSEVGELRKIVDDFIMSQQQSTAQPSSEDAALSDTDWFENPNEAVSKAISAHPDVRKAQEAAVAMQRTTSVQQLQARHPDAQQVLQNPAFLEWIKASPIRTELFARADRNYDFAAADELLSSFKERTRVAGEAVSAEKEHRRQNMAKASTGGGSAANTAGKKKIYRRADIIKLMKTDPDRYERLSGEIMQAYQEGRVR